MNTTTAPSGPRTYSQERQGSFLVSRNENEVAVRVRATPSGRACVTKVPLLLGLAKGSISPTCESDGLEAVFDTVDEADRVSGKRPRAPKGSNGISSYGRNMIRDAGGVFDQMPEYCRGAYCITCPGDGEELMDIWNCGFPEFLRVWHREFTRELKRNIPACDRDEPFLDWWAYVIEIQDRGAYHSHHMIPLKARNRAKDAFTLEEMDKFTWKIIRQVYGDVFDECPQESGNRLERIKYTCGGYYAKYLSKGINENCPNVYPTHWWGCSKSLRDEIKAQTFDSVFYVDNFSWERITYDLIRIGGVLWHYPVQIPDSSLERKYWRQVGIVVTQACGHEHVVASYFMTNHSEEYCSPDTFISLDEMEAMANEQGNTS